MPFSIVIAANLMLAVVPDPDLAQFPSAAVPVQYQVGVQFPC